MLSSGLNQYACVWKRKNKNDFLIDYLIESKIIKLKETSDVVKWVEPVCMCLEKKKQK